MNVPLPKYVIAEMERLAKMLTESPSVANTDTNTGEKQMSENRFKNIEVSIEREGTKIVLPKFPHPMSYNEAISCIQMRQQEEETVVSVNEEIGCFPLEGAYAFMKAMQRTYGWATPVPTKDFFGRDVPPRTFSLEIDLGVFTQVIWGEFKIPGIDGVLATGAASKDGRVVFQLGGKVRKKHQREVMLLADLTRTIVKNESIYKGKAIQLNCDDDGDLDLMNPPKFLDLSRVNPEELVFSSETMAQVQTNLFTPIEFTEECRRTKIPLKRGVLLEGPFGTGKTLTAFVAATKCVQNGWTFILIKKVHALKAALDFTKFYQPTVLFAEDVDRAVTGDRSIAMDDILNTIDGVESKGMEVMTVLTSNDVTSINRAMLRPGLLDAVIPIHAPDAVAVEKLIRLYARGLLEEGTNLTEAGKELAGQIPAVIREVVERAKLFSIGRTKTASITLSGDDLTQAAKGMKSHLALLNPSAAQPKSEAEILGEAFTGVLAKAQKSNGLYSKVSEMQKTVESIRENM